MVLKYNCYTVALGLRAISTTFNFSYLDQIYWGLCGYMYMIYQR